MPPVPREAPPGADAVSGLALGEGATMWQALRQWWLGGAAECPVDTWWRAEGLRREAQRQLQQYRLDRWAAELHARRERWMAMGGDMRPCGPTL